MTTFGAGVGSRGRPFPPSGRRGPASSRICGRVLTDRGGLLTVPYNGQSAVWARVAVEVPTGDDGREILDATSARDFLLDDGSGEVARVTQSTRLVFVGSREDAMRRDHGHQFPTSPMLAFLASRGHDLSFQDPIKVEEVVFLPGDRVTVVGPARRPATSGDEGAPLIIGPGASGDDEVVVFGESATPSYRLFYAGVAVLVLAVLLAVVGIVTRLV